MQQTLFEKNNTPTLGVRGNPSESGFFTWFHPNQFLRKTLPIMTKLFQEARALCHTEFNKITTNLPVVS